MITCSGQKGKQHKTIVFADGKCPLCLANNEISILNKKLTGKTTGSFRGLAEHLIEKNEQDIKALNLFLERNTSKLNTDMATSTRDSIVEETEFLRSQNNIESGVMCLTLSQLESKYYLTPSQVCVAEHVLKELSLDYNIKVVDGLQFLSGFIGGKAWKDY